MVYIGLYFVVSAFVNAIIELLASQSKDYSARKEFQSIVWQLVMWPYLLYMFFKMMRNNE
jgi:hypothetical protein